MTAARTIVIAGASGFVGRHLVATWRAAGHRVRMIGRAPTDDARWAAPASLGTVLENSDLLVNLAGRSVSCRYTKRNADAIFSSRDGTTAALGRALSETRRPPALWVNASTGTIYRDARDRPMDELTGEIGSGFSVEANTDEAERLISWLASYPHDREYFVQMRKRDNDRNAPAAMPDRDGWRRGSLFAADRDPEREPTAGQDAHRSDPPRDTIFVPRTGLPQ